MVSKATVLLLCALVCASTATSSAQQTDKTEAEKWREDLRLMAREMPRLHKNLFHTMTREQFEAAVKKLDERIPALARHQIIVEMMKIVAMVGDGHTSINPFFDPNLGFRYYPVKFYPFRDGLFVRSAAREYADIVGGRVIRIGRLGAEEAFRAVSEVSPRDNEMTLKVRVPDLMMIPEVLHALGIIDDMEKATLVVEKNGRQMAVDLKPAGRIQTRGHGDENAEPYDATWADARDGATAPTPLWLKSPRDAYWFEYTEDRRTIYVQYNQVFNKHGESIEAFFNRVFEFAQTHEVERFVLDIRLNGGGNSFLNIPIVTGIIRTDKINQRGKLFTIIGRGTFSAAQNLVNELERYTRTLFVGEPTASRPNQYGDHAQIVLPNSRISVNVSTLWHQMNAREPRRFTSPHIAAEMTSDQYAKNIDPAMEAVFNYDSKKELAAMLVDALNAKDIELAARRLKQFRDDPANAYANVEAQVNALGYRLMNANRLDDAIEIFKLNVEAYPRSWNVYDSLGEAYMNKGNRELAIKNYEKSLELNPQNGGAMDALHKLRAR
ncbi:MAG TPA: tetratricopeptide repeat protein [Blastocatellia bacterium]